MLKHILAYILTHACFHSLSLTQAHTIATAAIHYIRIYTHTHYIFLYYYYLFDIYIHTLYIL